MEWSNEDALLLIQEYQKYILLCNPKHTDHFNKIKKNDAWKEIAEACSVEIDEAKKKMSSLLGSFRREKAKGKKTVGTGTGAKDVYKTNWFAFKSLLFLEDRDQPRVTINTETIGDEVSEETGTNANETENPECEFEHASPPTEIREENTENFANSTQIEENNGATSKADLVSDSKKIKEKFMKPPTPKRKKQSKSDSMNDSQLQAALNFLQQPDDPTLMYTQHLANKLRQFSGRTRSMIEHAINQIIFEAEMGHYDNPVNNPHFRTQVPTPVSSPWSAQSNSSSNDNPLYNPHFRTQVPTPAVSPNAAQGSPWSAHTNSSSNSAQPGEQAQEEDNLLTALQPYITL